MFRRIFGGVVGPRRVLSSILRSNSNIMPSKRLWKQAKTSKRQKTELPSAKEGSNEEILYYDIRDLLSISRTSKIDTGTQTESNDTPPKWSPPERFSEIEVEIVSISSTGDGLGTTSEPNHVYVVPFTAPGDIIRARVVRRDEKGKHTLADLVEVLKPSPQRDDSRIECPYFSRCSGCQFQMLSYEDQLAHKKSIVERAYKHFFTLAPELLPEVEDTIGSPLRYGYRTKLTPHFDLPRLSKAGIKDYEHQGKKVFDEVPPIGFMHKGRRKVLDIEDCPIGTDAVREGMKSERARVISKIGTFKRGATILLRESTERIPKVEYESKENAVPAPTPAAIGVSKVIVSQPSDSSLIDIKTCITDHTAIATEYIDNHIFENTAGAFFQNNSSILPIFTSYIREHIEPPITAGDTTTTKYLIDAYCGSGLFTITLSSLFQSSIGIDIAAPSIAAAQKNAELNHVYNARFITASAAELFKEVTYPSEETAVVIDPPRKGCDDAFLQQLLRFGPRRVIYVSCNVHTQARDISVLVEGKDGVRYDVESLRGFDFFPQTSHVEGVAVLNRVKGIGKLEEKAKETALEKKSQMG